MARIDRHARDFALMAHQGQHYGTGPLPFSAHLIDVVEVLLSFHVNDPTILSVAWLHDILEDTPVTSEDLLKRFPDNIVRLVELVTDEEGATRTERKAKTYPKTASDSAAITVKLADRIANVRRTIEFEHSKEKFRKEYIAEYPDFRAALKKEGLYLDSTIGMMWMHLDFLIKTLEDCQTSNGRGC